MGFRDVSGKERVVVLVNALLRFAQLIVAAAALGLYGTQKGYWTDHDIPGRITFELVLGALALITALAFMVIPFFLSYRIIAIGAPWDLVLVVLWGAAFGLMKAIFLRSYNTNDDKFYHHGQNDRNDFINHWNTMMHGAWINLAGLILFLISGIMGILLFFIGRRTSRSKANYA